MKLPPRSLRSLPAEGAHSALRAACAGTTTPRSLCSLPPEGHSTLRAAGRVTDMTDLGQSPLGHATTYAEQYDPALLFPVERAPLRAELGLSPPLPFRGVDLWTAYELSWLDDAGKPVVAIATFAVPAESPAIVESKSVKLYLTAFNQTRFASGDDVAATVATDLSAATGAPVGVALVAPSEFAALAARRARRRVARFAAPHRTRRRAGAPAAHCIGSGDR